MVYGPDTSPDLSVVPFPSVSGTRHLPTVSVYPHPLDEVPMSPTRH